MLRYIIVVLFFCSSLAAFAQPAPEDLQQAEKLFTEGQKHYLLQEYDLAIVKFKESFRLSEAPELLYNIGQCQMFLKQYEEAIKSFKAFLWQAPKEAPNRALAEAKIEEAQAALESASKPVEPQSSPASQSTTLKSTPAATLPEKPSQKKSPLPLALYSASGASLLGGVVTFGAALSLKNQVAVLTSRSDSQLLQPTIAGKIESAGRLATASAVFFAVGLTAATAGVLLSKRERASLSVSTNGVALQVTF